jgi:hypothetical protein
MIRDEIEARLSVLRRENEEAPGSGASVAARAEEIAELEAALCRQSPGRIPEDSDFMRRSLMPQEPRHD